MLPQITIRATFYNIIHNKMFSDRSISLLNNLLLSPSPSFRCRIPSRAWWRNAGSVRGENTPQTNRGRPSRPSLFTDNGFQLFSSKSSRFYSSQCATTAFRQYSPRKSSLKNNLFPNSRNSFKLRIYTSTWYIMNIIFLCDRSIKSEFILYTN